MNMQTQQSISGKNAKNDQNLKGNESLTLY